MNKYETFAPLFPGFYGTIFEYSGEEQDIQSYNEENKTSLKWNDFSWDYADYHRRVSKSFVERLETELNQFLPIKLTYQQLSSPKEYNFSNDSIWIVAELDLDTLLKLIQDRKEAATKYFKDNYTSRDGFMSFHSNDIEDWLTADYILEKPAHRIGALLDCLCSIEIDKDDLYYWVDSEYWINFSPAVPA